MKKSVVDTNLPVLTSMAKNSSCSFSLGEATGRACLSSLKGILRSSSILEVLIALSLGASHWLGSDVQDGSSLDAITTQTLCGKEQRREREEKYQTLIPEQADNKYSNSFYLQLSSANSTAPTWEQAPPAPAMQPQPACSTVPEPLKTTHGCNGSSPRR